MCALKRLWEIKIIAQFYTANPKHRHYMWAGLMNTQSSL